MVLLGREGLRVKINVSGGKIQNHSIRIFKMLLGNLISRRILHRFYLPGTTGC